MQDAAPLVLMDGYRRVAALRKLGQDTALGGLAALAASVLREDTAGQRRHLRDDGPALAVTGD